MPSINMIAPRRAEKKRLERDMRRLVIVIMAELIFAVGLGGWVFTRVLTTNERVDDLKTELTKLRPAVKRIEMYDAATKGLAPKLNLLNQAKDRTMVWYNTLDRLTASMPASTYLTRLATTVDASGQNETVVNINGTSVSQERVGETMILLNSIPEFGKVDLHFTQKTRVSELMGFDWEVGATMKSSQSAEGGKANGSSQS